MAETNTNKIPKLVETNKIEQLDNFEPGRLIIQDDGKMFYEPSFAKTIKDRFEIKVSTNNDINGDVNSPISTGAVKTLYQDVLNNISHNEDNYQLLDATTDETDEDVLSRYGDTKKGDIAVIKRLINNTIDKYAYTGYVFDGTNWGAMDGNYDASNVYCDRDLIITSNIGVHEIDSTTGSKTLELTGKNLIEVLDYIMSEELMPTITQPYINEITLFHNDVKANATYEVGTTIKPSIYIHFVPGEYSYGPNTNTNFIKCRVRDTLGTSLVSYSVRYTLTDFDIYENDEYYVICSAEYSESTTIPLTNKGNPVPESKIGSGTTTEKKSNIIKGYREGFYYGDTLDYTREDIIKLSQSNDYEIKQELNTLIRHLNKTGKNYTPTGSKPLNYDIRVGAQTLIFAHQLDSVDKEFDVLNTTVNANMTQAIKGLDPITVFISGADNDPDSEFSAQYKIWLYSPAEPYKTSANLQITLK